MRFSRGQIALHWLTVALVVVLVGTGLAYSFDLAGDGAIVTHQWVGQALVLLIAARLAMRLARGTRPAPTDHAGWEKALAGVVHVALYAVLIAFVVTGYVSASALRDSALLFPVSQGFARSDAGEVLLEIHFALKFALAGLLVLHMGGAFKHALLDRDGTLSRMWFTAK